MMKKLFFLSTAIIAMILSSCSKDNEPTTPKPEVKIDIPEVTLPNGEVGVPQSIKFTSSVPWSITLSETKAAPSWFSVDKTSGEPGTVTITLTIKEANPSTTEARSGYIKISAGGASGTITITQPASKPIAVTGIALNKKTASITIGQKETLTTTFTPENATNKKVTWASDKTSVATVSETGEVTAVAVGTAIITVTTDDGKKTATCTVTVTPVTVTSVSLNKTTAALITDDTETLIATVNPENAANKKVTWKSDKPAIVTVSASGLIRAVSVGTAVITVTTEDGGKTATCTVTANPRPVDEVYFYPETAASLTVGSTKTLIAHINPSNATNKNVTWSSNNTAVATVSTSGVVTAKAVGTAVITVTTVDGGKTATYTITVKPSANSDGTINDWGNGENGTGTIK